MKLITTICSILLLVITGCETTDIKSGDSKTRATGPAVSDKDLQEYQELGELIFLHDQLAWKATDKLMQESLILGNTATYGWITVNEGDKWKVRWLGRDGDKIIAVCDVLFNSMNDLVIEVPANGVLSDLELALAKARDAAMMSVLEPCSETYNSVSFVHPDGEKIVAYALAATTEPDVLVVGGHYKVETSLDGTEVLNKRRFTKSCMNLSSNDPNLPKGAKLTAFYMTHLLDNTPVETHVYLSKTTDLALYILTGSEIWSVSNGGIRWVSNAE